MFLDTLLYGTIAVASGVLVHAILYRVFDFILNQIENLKNDDE